jgi:molybdopterin-guanine dinucleotide biosynthesis protein A
VEGNAKEILSVGGYVLAGGRSSRMGRDKALLTLAGKPLVEHAVTKLGRLCAKVSVLSGNSELAVYAPLVPDTFVGSGPLGGIEAALLDSEFAWNLILPVDMPFLPNGLLKDWIGSLSGETTEELRISMLSVGAQAYPTLLLLHRDVLPYLQLDLKLGRYRVLTSLESAARAIAAERQIELECVFWRPQLEELLTPEGRSADEVATEAKSAWAEWFANLNTPEDFAAAARNSAALDT